MAEESETADNLEAICAQPHDFASITMARQNKCDFTNELPVGDLGLVLQPGFLDTPDKGLMQHFVGKALLYPGRHPHLFETGFRLKRHLISMPLDRWVTLLFAVLREVTRSENRLLVVRKPPAKNVVSEIRFFDRQNGYRSWEPRLVECLQPQT